MFELFKRKICGGCRKKRFFVKKRRIVLPIGQTATSKEVFCNGCFKKLSEQFKS